eukprot:CAMPEP_0177451554 /NCGR_PEP_ID=MMETSP0369-20130122/9836_1 /TAXON_ID=447022 ORGANISM="Scrippsiella hangoei-like, Strain SHHI-4" /NCGR_SAMPLE_ID=MMETSP0369 /ASSEMBLY_ACC=CAM_ASM_000364 /LENGTH=125 /DNA_ID=CAMNT_0018924167 /DNA_START=113 /DNA_END=488 /DNA_ORIENTATION=-
MEVALPGRHLGSVDVLRRGADEVKGEVACATHPAEIDCEAHSLAEQFELGDASGSQSLAHSENAEKPELCLMIRSPSFTTPPCPAKYTCCCPLTSMVPCISSFLHEDARAISEVAAASPMASSDF